MKEPFSKSIDISKLTLDPNLAYLKLGINGQDALLVLGYQAGEKRIWFSEDKAIFKTQNGYLLGMQGFATNWEIISGPSLNTFPMLGLPTAYTRVRNEMPGYAFEIQESVLVTPLDKAPHAVSAELGSKPWRWFSEKVISRYGGQKTTYEYPGLFALDTSKKPYQVMYAQQCLKESYCLIWQSASQMKPINLEGGK